ncbi:ATP-dependent DNA helicase RecG [Mycetocola tolaasinivorans]|uniref:ATP-dependent DNA helicase RecG n=1 Tax=Mycetocola tolaasinivorans TaxID=76635 RepID=UPI001FEA4F3F|nr:ATP-dependent DNA helicase RecG [Mycetocola tolaasinivorans]
MSVSAVDARLDGVLGGRTAAAFERAFDVHTVSDLLTHYPRRYAKRGELTALDSLPLGESITIVADVIEVRERTMRARRGSILEVKITDGRGVLVLTFFNQAWRAKDLVPGARGIFAGKVGDYRGTRQLAHPDYELFDPAERELDSGDASANRWANQPIPIYPATATVASWQVAKAIGVVLDALPPLEDAVPASVREREKLLSYRKAVELIHRPEQDADWKQARHTLRYREAFLLQAALLQQRARARVHPTTVRQASPGGYRDRLDAALPFSLTDDQRTVSAEIEHDLAQDAPMNRLVQGEVGSGKTLVALRAMLAVADSGGQAALLAPTEVLASQHLRSIVNSLGPDLAAELMPTLLTGAMPQAERKRALLRVVSGAAKIVIGTHALLSDNVHFYDLGLVVVDEQHRFGVDQRETLREKGHRPPHTLVLTATPIPRTVAMTVFGDLDVSTIAQLPAGRQPIESFVVPLADRPGWMGRVWERMGEEIARGRQAFVVCPAIDPDPSTEPVPEPEPIAAPEPTTTGRRAPLKVAADVHAAPTTGGRGSRQSPDEQAGPGPADPALAEGDAPVRPRAAVETVLAELRQTPALAGLRIEPLHGRMSGEEKDATMRAFQAGEIHVLVATTVIEVGVDVANASTMVVLDADRFGVSQLHQLRGRVGRGGLPGLCLLVTAAPQETTARERVDAVASTLDGFELARIDLELRREGDVLGSVQSGGRSSLRLLRVVDDAEIIQRAREDAGLLVGTDPELTDQPLLREALDRQVDAAARAALAKN